jgi:hypothetical protein
MRALRYVIAVVVILTFSYSGSPILTRTSEVAAMVGQ